MSRFSTIRFLSAHPMGSAIILVAASAALGLGGAALTTGKLSETLVVGSITLVFGALLGGVVKLLLEDVQRVRDRRTEQARFLRAVLNDLKSVYDRVERVKVLIQAHRSAATYGSEMRDIIDSAVQLRNVHRALDQQTSNVSEPHLTKLRLLVKSMEKYLNALTDEFKEAYKPIADKQQIYEANFNAILKDSAVDVEPPDNPAWNDICGLESLREFLGRPVPREATSSSEGLEGDYERDFTKALDRASLILRSQLIQLG